MNNRYVETTNNINYFGLLPSELILKIFSYLSPMQLCLIMCVDKSCYAIASDNAIWEPIYNRLPIKLLELLSHNQNETPNDQEKLFKKYLKLLYKELNEKEGEIIENSIYKAKNNPHVRSFGPSENEVKEAKTKVSNFLQRDDKPLALFANKCIKETFPKNINLTLGDVVNMHDTKTSYKSIKII